MKIIKERKRIDDFVLASKWEEVSEDIKIGLSVGTIIGGVIAAVLAGVGLGLAVALFFIGVAYKLLTANIW